MVKAWIRLPKRASSDFSRYRGIWTQKNKKVDKRMILKNTQ
jgi:hypothetical protein